MLALGHDRSGSGIFLVGREHDTDIIDGTSYPIHYVQDILDRCWPISDFQIVVKDAIVQELRIVASEDHREQVTMAVHEFFPSLALRRIDAEDLVFVGVRGKFSYLIRETT